MSKSESYAKFINGLYHQVGHLSPRPSKAKLRGWIENACDSQSVDVCVTTRGHTATERPDDGLRALPPEGDKYLSPLYKFKQALCHAMGGYSMASIDACVAKALRETGLVLTEPEVTVTKTEAGNTVISEREPTDFERLTMNTLRVKELMDTDAFRNTLDDSMRKFLADPMFGDAVRSVVANCLSEASVVTRP